MGDMERGTREQEAKHRTISRRNNSHMEKVTKEDEFCLQYVQKRNCIRPSLGVARSFKRGGGKKAATPA